MVLRLFDACHLAGIGAPQQLGQLLWLDELVCGVQGMIGHRQADAVGNQARATNSE